jgi:hypothetical protein
VDALALTQSSRGERRYEVMEVSWQPAKQEDPGTNLGEEELVEIKKSSQRHLPSISSPKQR